ncbi:MAG: VOC family protein [Candidatus Sumerlaeaceae bacterium]
MQLYETHLPVTSTEASAKFYIDIVGLEFGYRAPTRDAVFLFFDSNKKSMLGLWGPTTAQGANLHPCHFAIAIPLADLLTIGSRLNSLGITTRDFEGRETAKPSVIGWMPSAQIYFLDPDGNSVEFITMLDNAPDPSFYGSLSTWLSGGCSSESSADP